MNTRRLLYALVSLFLFVSWLRGQDYWTWMWHEVDEQIPGPDNAKSNTGQCCILGDQSSDQGTAFYAWVELIRHRRTERQIRSTRSLPTCHPAACNNAVIRR